MRKLYDARNNPFKVRNAPLLVFSSFAVRLNEEDPRETPAALQAFAFLGWVGFWAFVGVQAWMEGGRLRPLVFLIFPTVLGFAAWHYFRFRCAAILQMRSAQSLCLCCGYALKDIAADHDDCRVCPECGHAWRLPLPRVPFPRRF